MSDDLTVAGVDGIRRSFDEHYDTVKEVVADPYGAWDAIQEAADRIEELEAKLAKAVEALTPSGDTKAAYIAEVETDCPCGRPHTVSWTATKDIMKMIRERAELKGKTDGR
jgi:23S rRNA G2069 N7-methylase RlmK/C1962 C5-methylase RlmI